MKIRHMTPEDIDAVRLLHHEYYPELVFPDFLNLLSAFVIEDDKGEIIIAGGIEQVAEAILITNKAKSRIKIGKALVEAQLFSLFTCGRFGIKELYAFVNNDDYARHLIKHGFQNSNRALSIRVS